MARKRKKARKARKSNPAKKRHHGRRKARRHNPAHFSPKRRRHSRRRRSNPGLSDVLIGGGVGILAGIAASYALNKLGASLPSMARTAIRVAGVGAVAYFAGDKHPEIAAGVATGLAAPVVRDLVAKVAPEVAINAIEAIEVSPRALLPMGAVPQHFYGPGAMEAIEPGLG